ncbi:MAG: sigma-54-dependent Fis family transcriptional regulator [Candidatus Helarchaeota archaeon]|nr:sigma-54-dependent Fis family transcriptional regulator [Candidatus Helarchaeota archaeon]
MENFSFLCVDDDKNVVNALKIILNKSGFNVFTALNGFEALDILKSEQIDIAIIDYKMPKMNGTELLKKIKKLNHDVEVLILTGHGTIPNAVESIKIGAFDYILKPFHKEDILNSVEKIVQVKKLQDEKVMPESQLKKRYQFDNLIGSTPGMVEILNTIKKIANSNSLVFIIGETGSGKEEIAKAIHYNGIRSQKKFSIIDCASINPNLFESELFGHVKGAFTGAINDKIGLLKATGDGTIFLDEIADIPMYIQVKLLRAIEERVIRPVGSIQPQKFTARIIAATSKNLTEAINKREFREDLYYRLSVVTINVPPLRERSDDIPLLVNHFIQKFDNNRNLINKVSDEALNTLMNYHWPGNVRELKNCIERAFTLGAKRQINLKDLPDNFHAPVNRITESKNADKPTMSEYEKEIIIKAINASKGNKRKAARDLNIGIATLYRKLKKYNLCS